MTPTTYKGYSYEYDLTGATMLPHQYIALIDILQEKQPKRICELGCGQTTLIFEQYCQKNKGCILNSIEHDDRWARKDTILMPVQDHTNIIIGGQVYNNLNKYCGFEEWLEKQDPYDFVCVDGPRGDAYRMFYNYGRIQLVSFILLNKLNHNSIVLFHDSQRQNEIRTYKEFQKFLTYKRFSYQRIAIPSEFKNNNAELSIYKIT